MLESFQEPINFIRNHPIVFWIGIALVFVTLLVLGSAPTGRIGAMKLEVEIDQPNLVKVKQAYEQVTIPDNILHPPLETMPLYSASGGNSVLRAYSDIGCTVDGKPVVCTFNINQDQKIAEINLPDNKDLQLNSSLHTIELTYTVKNAIIKLRGGSVLPWKVWNEEASVPVDTAFFAFRRVTPPGEFSPVVQAVAVKKNSPLRRTLEVDKTGSAPNEVKFTLPNGIAEDESVSIELIW